MAEALTTNAAEVAAKLNHVAARVGDPAPALERARQLIAQGESTVFATEGASIGEHWPPAVEPEGSQLLVLTGQLRASLTGTGAGEVSRDELHFGTNVPYARFHQYGTRRMAARPVLGIPGGVAREATEALTQLLEDTWR